MATAKASHFDKGIVYTHLNKENGGATLKLFYAKKEHVCFRCRATIMVRDIFVRLMIKGRQNGSIVGLIFHPECFMKWNEETFVKRFLAWKLAQNPPPKRGRKLVPTTDRPKRRRLLSLRSYHQRKGNETRVREVNLQIKELEYGSTH